LPDISARDAFDVVLKDLAIDMLAACTDVEMGMYIERVKQIPLMSLCRVSCYASSHPTSASTRLGADEGHS